MPNTLNYKNYRINPMNSQNGRPTSGHCVECGTVTSIALGGKRVTIPSQKNGVWVCNAHRGKKNLHDYSDENDIRVGKGNADGISISIELESMGRSTSARAYFVKNKFLPTYDSTVDIEYKSPIYTSELPLAKIVGAIEYMNEYSYNTSIDLQRIKENFIEPNAISFWQLPDTISFYEKAGFSAKKHWMRFLSILISPFLLVGMVMIAAIFMLQNTQRGSGILLRVVLSIVTGFVVYFSSQVVYAFGVNGYIPVWLSVSAPTLIILLTSSSLLISADEV